MWSIFLVAEDYDGFPNIPYSTNIVLTQVKRQKYRGRATKRNPLILLGAENQTRTDDLLITKAFLAIFQASKFLPKFTRRKSFSLQAILQRHSPKTSEKQIRLGQIRAGKKPPIPCCVCARHDGLASICHKKRENRNGRPKKGIPGRP